MGDNTSEMRRKAKRQMTAVQARAVAALRANIQRLDCDSRRTPAGRRVIKVWQVDLRGDGRAVVTSVAGWPTHPFDDITRIVKVGPRGGYEGFRNQGHGSAGDTRDCRGPRLLYEMNARALY